MGGEPASIRMSRRRRFASDHWTNGQVPLLVLMGVIVVVFVMQEVLPFDAFLPLMVVPGEIGESWQAWREGGGAGPLLTLGTLLTSAFLHDGLGHLLFNLLFLWIFASQISELLGAGWMFLVFGLTAVTGSLCHVWLNAGEMVPMLGASGAVMGFEGAYLALALRWRLPVAHVWPMARPMEPSQFAAVGVVGLMMDFIGMAERVDSQVAYGAHVGGFAGGLVLVALLAPRPDGAVAR